MDVLAIFHAGIALGAVCIGAAWAARELLLWSERRDARYWQDTHPFEDL
jgi:hypothetical protein